MPGFDNQTMFAEIGSDVGDFPNTTSSDNSTQFSRNGSDVTSIVNNTSDTVSSGASYTARTEGDSGGDPYVKFQVGGSTSFAVGIDNDDADRWKITRDPSGTVDPSSGTELFFLETIQANFIVNTLNNNKVIIGDVTQIQVINEDVTDDPSSTARYVARTGSETASAYILFDVENSVDPGSTSWKCGSNGTEGGSLQFRSGVNGGVAGMGGTIRQSITKDGEVRFPTTPAFLAYLPIADNNVTGAGALYTLGTNVALTEVFDQGNNFNTNGTFTAPITGRYQFEGMITVRGITAAMNFGQINIVTSNRTYQGNAWNPANARMGVIGPDACSYLGTCLADMDAGDTATFTIRLAAGAADTVDISADSTNTFISGMLAA